jgi:hypothetical protein
MFGQHLGTAQDRIVKVGRHHAQGFSHALMMPDRPTHYGRLVPTDVETRGPSRSASVPPEGICLLA